ncbi:hypothetical protein [Salinibius halmophilus]|uniref:hypothetical protein n=1 Tax=Salinibius halmophilus TaxID=1853216 RepID=UPI000E66E6F0|nr:hypothetical protein [Salinibius halmophilus]
MFSKATKEYLKVSLPLVLVCLFTIIALFLLLIRPMLLNQQSWQQQNLSAIADMTSKQIAADVLQQDWLAAQIVLADIIKLPAVGALELEYADRVEIQLGELSSQDNWQTFPVSYNGSQVALIRLQNSTTLMYQQIATLINGAIVLLAIAIGVSVLAAVRMRQQFQLQRKLVTQPLANYAPTHLSKRLESVQSVGDMTELISEWLPELRLAITANQQLTSQQINRLRRNMTQELVQKSGQHIVLWADSPSQNDDQRQRIQQLMYRIAPMYQGRYSPVNNAIVFAIEQELSEAAWQAVCCAWVIRATIADDDLAIALHSGELRMQVDDYCGLKLARASGTMIENGQRMTQFCPASAILISEPTLDLLDSDRLQTTMHRDMPLPDGELLSLWLLDDLANPYGSVLNRQAQQLELT